MGFIAKFLAGLEDMPVRFITKPHKAFICAAAKLCAMFSFLVFLSFTPLIGLFLSAVYAAVFYFTYVFMKLCAGFGYKKIMIAAVFVLLYFLCFIGTALLRNFLAALYFGNI